MSDSQVKIDKGWNERINQLFEECAKNLKENVSYSQVLFRFNQKEESIAKAEEIVKNLEIDIISTEIFNFPKDSVSFALFKLNVVDIRETILSLAEEGYTLIKGYSASFNR
ncbi:hypothetical protein J7K55_02095 [Candidatus Aerophobetes bacterium]|nr:hypothetical protein [Candidatus Aerophobetes bacterium]